MIQGTTEKPALLIIDLVKDTFDAANRFPVTPFAREIVEPINVLTAAFRKQGWPIVFSTDAFHEDDFIFKGRMKPHALAGTPGAEVADELDRSPEDLWLPKPRFSAFFGTELDKLLKQRGVTLCAVAGVSTNVCVLTTAMDALCFDYKAVLLEDCTAAASREVHEQILNCYRRTPLDPLLRVMNSRQLIDALGKG
ncbi:MULTISPECIES: cysteine hydrolase family protein [Desulfococcus]|jgi:nicotinamidase-related amidase|uniref:Isochorismatase hydrolase n=1 Tax=Desulfococcus multivorans DSM 2059 TaxID=1121405 RepID=S7U6N9_DESML|nr:isochorismatase family cysteine hydrolase [Desulfococcus multivorans]AOY59270.1 isochorismatase family protein [Desulfococcus multivorans]AQV01492.1 isochorismatase [Desulfococcus multivorans]EPR45022.1 isochorismatase hydrolase [Desulfococcus multivorans DSM 2059]MDX9817959.1 isochorismatase family cysteine hydrolase [Desulfococcus multivorans]SKA26844.1 Nicotinamidase-related amidase [Desulfococcus multivorans DSM 2059]